MVLNYNSLMKKVSLSLSLSLSLYLCVCVCVCVCVCGGGGGGGKHSQTSHAVHIQYVNNQKVKKALRLDLNK